MIYSLIKNPKKYGTGAYSPDNQNDHHDFVYGKTFLLRPRYRVMGEGDYSDRIIVNGSIDGAPTFVLPETDYKKNGFASFSLIAVPTKKIFGGKIVPIMDREEQVHWLIRKLNGSIFIQSEHLQMIQLPQLERVSTHKHVCYPVCLFRFKGIIADPDKIVEMLKVGIGRRKAYGFGLLLDDRVSQHFTNLVAMEISQ